MAHNIWGSKFAAVGDREAVWHKIGTYNIGTRTATETLEILGEHKVEKQPLFYYEDGVLKESSYSLIVRNPTNDEPEYKVFGAPVHHSYELINPYQAAQMWDKKTAAPVETMAMIDKGAAMFITAKLPTFDVAGFDQVRNYLLFSNPMKNGVGAAAYITSVRTVCENTLRAGIAAASQVYTISHRAGGRALLGDWLKERWAEANMLTDVLQETYDLLAKKTVREVQVKWIAEELYPLPSKPDRERPRIAPYKQVKAEWERELEKAKTLRTTVVELWNGAGTGLDDSRLRGTAWSAWNAVAEVESYRKGRAQAMVMSLTNGERANRIMQAQRLLTAMDGKTRRAAVKV